MRTAYIISNQYEGKRIYMYNVYPYFSSVAEFQQKIFVFLIDISLNTIILRNKKKGKKKDKDNFIKYWVGSNMLIPLCIFFFLFHLRGFLFIFSNVFQFFTIFKIGNSHI